MSSHPAAISRGTLVPAAASMRLEGIAEHPGQAEAASQYCGFVETLDAEQGLLGWATHREGAHLPTLSLWADDQCIAQTRVTVPRPDIWQGASQPATGFGFDRDELLRASARTDLSAQALLRVRVHASGQISPQHAQGPWLPSAQAWTFADLQLLRHQEEQQDYLLAHPGPLPAELRRLVRSAYRSLSLPLRADARRQVGVVEFAVRLSDAQLLIGGWMRASQPARCAMVVMTGGRKHAAAMAVAKAPRPDLPSDAQAFAGVLTLEAPLDATDLQRPAQLFFAGRALDWLEPVQALRRPSLEEAWGETQHLLARATGETGEEIANLVRACLPWHPGAQKNDSLGVKVGVDHCILAPGFGLFIAGWLLHPMSHLVQVRARLGRALFQLDMDTLTLSDRHDLAQVFPPLGDRTAQAGFSCLLRGDSLPGAAEKWLLRFEFADGSVHLHEISQDMSRRIDAGFDYERLAVASPGLEWAPWLEDFGATLQATARHHHTAPDWELAPQALPRVLVAALPLNASHQLVALTALERCMAMLAPQGVALLVLSPQTLAASTWHAWAAHQQTRHPGCKLAALRQPAGSDSWLQLPEVLERYETERFAYLGPEVIATAQGASALSDWFAQDSGALRYFNIEYLRGSESLLAQESQAFAWSTSALLPHLLQAPQLLPGHWRTNGLPARPNPPAASTGPAHFMRLSRPDTGSTRDRINERILATHTSKLR